MTSSAAPTKVRFSILGMATVVAFLMYLDRICLAAIVTSDSFRQSLPLQGWQTDWVKGAFFWAYALAQVPAGWLSDRFGTRILVSIYILAWSLCTVATGFSWSFSTLLLARLGCGLAEAGYYPASSGLLTRWSHIGQRGLASSLISFGGRIGGALAPWLTTSVILHLGGWRWAGWLYGGFGVIVAAAYWRTFREHPRLHPRCNAAEVALLAEGRGEFQPVREPPRHFPWGPVTRNSNLWLMNAYQFLANLGWAFLILSLPDYLQKVMHLDEKQASTISTMALGIGIAALPLGGMLTDLFTRKFGLRRGRLLPLACTRFIAAGFYVTAIYMESPWAMALAFGAVAFFADLALPATWAFMQDVSGKHQAQIFGWSNMWGNFGAAVQPVLFATVLTHFDSNHDYHEGILFCAGTFLIAGVIALWLDAQRPVNVPE